MRTVLCCAIAALLFAGCAGQESTEQLRRDNAAVPGATPEPPPMTPRGGIAW